MPVLEVQRRNFSEWVEKHHRRPVMFKLALGTTRATSDLCFNIQFHRFDQREAVVKVIGWYLWGVLPSVGIPDRSFSHGGVIMLLDALTTCLFMVLCLFSSGTLGGVFDHEKMIIPISRQSS